MTCSSINPKDCLSCLRKDIILFKDTKTSTSQCVDCNSKIYIPEACNSVYYEFALTTIQVNYTKEENNIQKAIEYNGGVRFPIKSTELGSDDNAQQIYLIIHLNNHSKSHISDTAKDLLLKLSNESKLESLWDIDAYMFTLAEKWDYISKDQFTYIMKWDSINQCIIVLMNFEKQTKNKTIKIRLTGSEEGYYVEDSGQLYNPQLVINISKNYSKKKEANLTVWFPEKVGKAWSNFCVFLSYMMFISIMIALTCGFILSVFANCVANLNLPTSVGYFVRFMQTWDILRRLVYINVKYGKYTEKMLTDLAYFHVDLKFHDSFFYIENWQDYFQETRGNLTKYNLNLFITMNIPVSVSLYVILWVAKFILYFFQCKKTRNTVRTIRIWISYQL